MEWASSFYWYKATTLFTLILRPVHTVHFFLIAAAILLIVTNGLYRIQWKCSHCATVTTSPTPYVAHYKQETNRSRNQKKSHSVNKPLEVEAHQTSLPLPHSEKNPSNLFLSVDLPNLNVFCSLYIYSNRHI